MKRLLFVLASTATVCTAQFFTTTRKEANTVELATDSGHEKLIPESLGDFFNSITEEAERDLQHPSSSSTKGSSLPVESAMSAGIDSHVLDITKGQGAANVPVTLYIFFDRNYVWLFSLLLGVVVV